MKLEILTDRNNHQNEVNYLRQEWLDDLFLYLGIDLDYLNSLELSKRYDYLYKNNIETIYYMSIGGLEVHYNGDLVGEWGGPEYKLKVDENDQYYFKITVECWTIQEEEILQCQEE